ncbi:MAG: nitroreductase family deazaflavin-dependent oxidoreductase [Proteobacteria bacterium]|nr:nitroreductase family deazaflavin-dependent oxidoreductase [Pseudomonadota bacterium]
MAEHFLYLTTTGRTTGQARKIEIWFVEHGGRYYLVSEHGERANWVKNIANDPNVAFSIGQREVETDRRPLTPAVARFVDRDDELELVDTIRGLMNKKYNWSNDLVVELTPYNLT